MTTAKAPWRQVEDVRRIEGEPSMRSYLKSGVHYDVRLSCGHHIVTKASRRRSRRRRCAACLTAE